MGRLLDKSALLMASVVGRVSGGSPGTPAIVSLVDFGTDTVKAAVLRREDSGVRVLGAALASAGQADLSAGRSAVGALATAAEKALSDAEDQTAGQGSPRMVPDRAVFCVPTRLTKGQAFSVRQRRADASVPVSPREVKDAWERLEKSAVQKLPGLAQDGVTWRALALMPGVVRIDGLQVSDAVGMKGGLLCLEAFGVAVWPAVLRALEAVARRLELDVLDVVAVPHALSAVVPQRDAVLLDVGFAGTSISVVRHNALAASQWWAQGGSYFTASLANAFRCSTEDAEALKLAYSSGGLSGDDVRLVERPLNQALQVWRESLVKRLNWMMAGEGYSPATVASDGKSNVVGQPGHALPGRFFVTGGGSLTPGLLPAVRSVEAGVGLRFNRAVEVESLGKSLSIPEGSMPLRYLDIPRCPESDLLAPVMSLAACANW